MLYPRASTPLMTTPEAVARRPVRCSDSCGTGCSGRNAASDLRCESVDVRLAHLPDILARVRTPDRARYAGQQGIEIKSPVLPELYMPLHNARSLMAAPRLPEIVVLRVSKCVRRHLPLFTLFVRTTRLTSDRDEARMPDHSAVLPPIRESEACSPDSPR